MLATSSRVFLTLVSRVKWHPLTWRALSISPYTEAGKSRWCDTGLYARCRHPNYLGQARCQTQLYVIEGPLSNRAL